MIPPLLATIRAKVEALDVETRMEWEERAGIIEFEGKRERTVAEWLAWQEVKKGSTWDAQNTKSI